MTGGRRTLNLSCEGKSYLVMASSKGLGRAVAEEIAREGGRVLGTSRVAGQSFVLDTGDPASRQTFLARIKGERLNGIFVNTGGPRAGGALQLDAEDWLAAFQQLLLGPLELVRALVPQVEREGAILFNTSSSIAEPIAGLALSNVMRAGIHALVKTLVDELAPLGIRVNLIVPGRIDTDRVRELDEQAGQRSGVTVDDIRRRSEDRIPLRRYGKPEEFGRLAAFLLSPAASYLNGSSYWIDGGQRRSL